MINYTFKDVIDNIKEGDTFESVNSTLTVKIKKELDRLIITTNSLANKSNSVSIPLDTKYQKQMKPVSLLEAVKTHSFVKYVNIPEVLLQVGSLNNSYLEMQLNSLNSGDWTDSNAVLILASWNYSSNQLIHYLNKPQFYTVDDIENSEE